MGLFEQLEKFVQYAKFNHIKKIGEMSSEIYYLTIGEHSRFGVHQKQLAVFVILADILESFSVKYNSYHSHLKMINFKEK
jgi:hypothetical protein